MNMRKIKYYSRLFLQIIKRKNLELKRKQKYKPAIIQLPITYKCNFNCVMCGMQKLTKNKDFTPQDLEYILKDELFQNVKAVGINGGEPFLKQNLEEYIDKVLMLPKLKNIYFISNGYLTDIILEKLKIIKEKASKNNVKINISISVDGIDEMQDLMRGHKNAFIHADKTIREILNNKKLYTDNIDIICTITKINIYNINEVVAWAENLGINVAYNIATINKRIENEEKYQDFSIFTDEHARLLAQEFFYGLFRKTRSEKYFAIYYFIRYKKRLCYCDCDYNEITINPNCELSFCATYSDFIGNAKETPAHTIVKNNQNYLNTILKNDCKNCHHYMYKLNSKGIIEYYKELIRVSI